MSIEELQDIAMLSKDIDEVRECFNALSNRSASLYESLPTVQTNIEAHKIKADLTRTNNLLEICRDRMYEVKNTTRQLDHNFRLAAREMLKKETYDKIKEMALFKRRDVKRIKYKLRSNPIE